MDLWKYYSIGHRHHLVCNPLSEAKLDEIVELMALPEHARILDIGCGKGEFLVRTAARWRCTAVGVDLSPFFVADARARVKSAGLDSSVEIVQGDGREYNVYAMGKESIACPFAGLVVGSIPILFKLGKQLERALNVKRSETAAP